MNFEMEVMNILEMKAYELTNEENVPVTKIGLIRRVCNSYRHSPKKKRKIHNSRKSFLDSKQ